MFILKSGDSGYTARIDNKNRIQTFSTIQTDSTSRALEGDSYNINTGVINLTSSGESGLLYMLNTGNVPWTVGRVFYNSGISTGGSGDWLAEIIANPTAGTLISGGTDLVPSNFNFGSPKTLASTTKKGAEGSTVSGGDVRISTIIPASGDRILIPFDSIIIEPGTSMAMSITPQTGNTSMNIQVGVNLHMES